MRSLVREINGVPMRWDETGEGIPVVYLHGVPTGPRLWRRVIPHVLGAHSFAFELVGYGRSIVHGVGRDISVARQAEYLRQWMDALGLRQAILVGHDIGGGVAQVFAVNNPGRVLGLLFANSVAYDSWPIPSVRAMAAIAPAIRRLPTQSFRRLHGRMIRRGHSQKALGKIAASEHFRPYAQADGARAFVRQIRSLRAGDTATVTPRLRRLRLPARVVWGAKDRYQKVDVGERLARDLGTRLVRIEGGRHFTPEDHPIAIATELQALLAEVALRAANETRGGSPHP